MGIEKLSTIWPEWKVVDQIGEGSFGKVYKVVREEHGITDYAAIKVISIPQSDAEITSLRAEGLDATGTRSYFEGIVTDFVNEIKLMVSMKGTSNIVSVEDYKVQEKTDKIGWNIYIRMELLTSLNEYIAEKKLTETEVIKLGQDICTALQLCAQRNIIHRDVKPENIFVSSFGDFKIGDFGIARELEKTGGSLSSKGTYSYMAPEVKNSNHYDATVDTYSLGLVLYKLLNNNRLPFLNPHMQLIQYQDRKNALQRRLDGELLPTPVGASNKMALVIMKACSFDPQLRYKSAAEMNVALETVKTGTYQPEPKDSDIANRVSQVANNIVRAVCTKCGSELRSGNIFCHACGNRVVGGVNGAQVSPQLADEPSSKNNTFKTIFSNPASRRICFIAIGIIAIFIIGGIIMSNLSNAVPNVEKLITDIPYELTGYYYDGQFISMDVKNLDIDKRQTNDKTDLVYCIIDLESDSVHRTAFIQFTYNY